jgi:hypothetical protein
MAADNVTGASTDPAWLQTLVAAGEAAANAVIGQASGALNAKAQQAEAVKGTAAGEAKSVATATGAFNWRGWLPWIGIAAAVAAAFWFFKKG